MFRKIFLLITALVFFSALRPAAAMAKTPVLPTTTVTPSPAVLETYQLPYPGMLPDSPLFKVKTLRDKILLYFTTDYYKKARLQLHLADKTLFAALKMAEKGNLPLAVHTAFKGEHYYTLMVSTIRNAVYYGQEELNNSFVDQAYKAFTAHQNLIDGMIARADGENKTQLEQIKAFSVQNRDELIRFQKEIKTQIEEKQKLLEQDLQN